MLLGHLRLATVPAGDGTAAKRSVRPGEWLQVLPVHPQADMRGGAPVPAAVMCWALQLRTVL
jgi:hypothetical protein